MQPTTTTTSEQTPPMPIPDFISGQLTKLRPVLEADIPTVVRLMTQAPRGFSWERQPWTVQRLKKEFEDEKQPGLWNWRKRYLVITDLAGAIVGVLQEQLERLGAADIEFHLADDLPERNALGPDALATYIEYKRSWQHIPRIGACLLEFQDAERDWLLACGFEHEMRCAEAWLHRGEAIAFDLYAWIPQWVQANRAPDGIGQ